MFGIQFALHWLRNKGGRRRKPARHQPVLEYLEDRHLLSGITAGPDGNLWLAEGDRIERFALDGTATDFALPTPTSRALAITPGPDGNLWFTEADHDLFHFFDGKIGRITPDGALTEFQIPTPHAMYPGSPAGITAGPDGNLWFTEPLAGQIGRITPDGTLTEFPLPAGSADPDGITAGPDGNFWFTEANEFTNGNKIGRITPDGTLTEFPLPTPNSLGFTEEITAGPDGNLWFTEGNRDQIGRMTPDGALTEFALPTPSFDPLRGAPGITAGPDGNVWFTEFNSSQIGQITPNGSITEFPLADRTFPREITAGPDGNIWFTKNSGNGIGEFVLNGGGGAAGLARTVPAAQGPQVGKTAAGTGLINASVLNNAKVDLGQPGSPRILTIVGDYTQTSDGVLVVEIGGRSPGASFDQLNVAGRAAVDGTLTINLINGFQPSSGDSFTIMTFGSETGAFATINGDAPLFTASFDPTDVALVAN